MGPRKKCACQMDKHDLASRNSHLHRVQQLSASLVSLCLLRKLLLNQSSCPAPISFPTGEVGSSAPRCLLLL